MFRFVELRIAAADGDKVKAQELLRRNADVNRANVSGAGSELPDFHRRFWATGIRGHSAA